MHSHIAEIDLPHQLEPGVRSSCNRLLQHCEIPEANKVSGDDADTAATGVVVHRWGDRPGASSRRWYADFQSARGAALEAQPRRAACLQFCGAGA